MSTIKHSRWPVVKRILIAVTIYMVLAVFYYTTLWLNRQGNNQPNDPYFNLWGFLNGGGVDYVLKGLISLPFWWLFFRRLRNLSLWKRLLLHIPALPVFVLCWQKSYYLVTEWLGMGHLTGSGQVWDIYIPSLFYILQFGVLHAYDYFKISRQNIRDEAYYREAILKSELQALKAQLNPHFLYNVFNTINASVPPGMENTRSMIGELSDMFRYQLRASRTELVPLAEEMEFTQKYLSLEKARFDDRLDIRLDIDPALLDLQVPPMLIQPLVENAVKHGISPKINGGSVEISVKRRLNEILISVSDTGVGVSNKDTLLERGIGLTNTQLRLNKIYGTSLEFLDNLPGGLTVQFAIR